MSEIGVNVRRPEGLPSEFKLQKILQSDPHHRFVFKGKVLSPAVLRPTKREDGYLWDMEEDLLPIHPLALLQLPRSGRGSGGGYGFPFGMQDITTTATTSSTTSTPGPTPGPWNLMTRQYGGSSNSNYGTAIRQMDHTPPPKSSSSSSSSVNDNIQYSHPMSLSSSASSAPLSLCLPAPPLHWQQQEQDDDFHEGIEPFLENSSSSYFSVDPMTSIPSSPIPNPAANSNTHTNSNTGPPPPGFLSSPWSQSATS
eukprot:gene39386-51912_t